MATPTVYVICDQNCKFEGLTKEQILTAITQAVNEGTIGDIDTGFITTVKTINNTPLRFFVGAQNEYDALSDEAKQNLFAIITNDTTKEGIEAAIKELQESKTAFENVMTGNTPVPKAEAAKWLKDCKEANHASRGFIIDEAGIYVLIGVKNSEENTAIYFTEIVAIPSITRQAKGTYNGTEYNAYYGSATPSDVSTYRLQFNDSNMFYYKAFKIMSL